MSDGPDGLGIGARYFSGAAWNFCAHPEQQKEYARPPCSKRAGALSRVHLHAAYWIAFHDCYNTAHDSR